VGELFSKKVANPSESEVPSRRRGGKSQRRRGGRAQRGCEAVMLRASEQPERGRGAAGEARYHVPGGGAKGVRAGDAPPPTPGAGHLLAAKLARGKGAGLRLFTNSKKIEKKFEFSFSKKPPILDIEDPILEDGPPSF